jgi:hypothetical protein
MNAMIVENIISWLLFALASTCTLSFASSIYDNFISSKRRERIRKASPEVVPVPELKPSQQVIANPVIRGYDSPELFREDLWIRRIEQSRKEHAPLAASMPQVSSNDAAPENYPKRLCEMLASQVRTRPR